MGAVGARVKGSSPSVLTLLPAGAQRAAQLPGGLAIEGEDEAAGRTAIEPMHRVHVPPELVAHDLQQRDFTPAEAVSLAELVAVDNRARRLGHYGEAFGQM